MAMMVITKFHKLIQSKLLWGGFLVIIVFSFVIWGTPYLFSGGKGGGRESGEEGMLYGKPVARADFYAAHQHVYAGIALSMGHKPNLPDGAEKMIRQSTWRRIVMLKEAEKLGLRTANPEVQSTIQSQPMFRDNAGQFSLGLYQTFLARSLGEMGFSEAFFEEHIREEITLQKLRMMMAQAVLPPPGDILRVFSLLQDTFQLEYVTLAPELVEKSVTVSPEMAQAFFERDRAHYTIPAQARAKYVFFARNDHTNGLPAVSDSDAQDYYDDHGDEFSEMIPATETNAAASATNAVEKAEPKMIKHRKEFETVKSAIVARIAQGMAMDRAEQAANEFVGLVAGDRSGKPLSFEEAAARVKTTVRTLAPFSAKEAPAGIAAGPDFNEAVFALSADSTENFTSPVRGEDGSYVATLVEKIAPRVPAFEEVRAAVTAEARAAAVSDALMAKAKAVREAGRRAGAKFVEAAKGLGLKPVVTPEFTLSKGLGDDPHSDLLMPAVISCNAGEFTDILPAGEGVLIVARLAQRRPADPALLPSLRPEIVQMLSREREREVVDSWEEALLKQAHFKDTAVAREKDDADDRS